MNFINPAFDGTRGVANDAAFANSSRPATPRSRSLLRSAFATPWRRTRQVLRRQVELRALPDLRDEQGLCLSRPFADPSKGKTYGYTVEWGTQFQPPWAEMELIVQDVTAGLIELCVAAPCGGGLIAVTLDTPTIQFDNVPEGVETVRAVVFSVETCAAVDFEVVDGPSATSGPARSDAEGGASLTAAPSSVERQARFGARTRDRPRRRDRGPHHHPLRPDRNRLCRADLRRHHRPARVASVMVLDRSGAWTLRRGFRAGPARRPSRGGADLRRPDAGHERHSAWSASIRRSPAMPFEEAGAMGSGNAATSLRSDRRPHDQSAGEHTRSATASKPRKTARTGGRYDHKAIVVSPTARRPLEADRRSRRADQRARLRHRPRHPQRGRPRWSLNALVNLPVGYLLMVDQLGPTTTFRLAKYFVQILAGGTNGRCSSIPTEFCCPAWRCAYPSTSPRPLRLGRDPAVAGTLGGRLRDRDSVGNRFRRDRMSHRRRLFGAARSRFLPDGPAAAGRAPPPTACR